MSRHLGRELLTEEYVHHKNGDGLDNRLANLEIADFYFSKIIFDYHEDLIKRMPHNTCRIQWNNKTSIVYDGR